jgi:DNA-binding GntR family transcriptional regulator
MYESLELEQSSTVDRAADALRRALFGGDLEPGTPLREVALADSLGIARSTVREALGLLATEGLVHRIPYRGVVVAALDPGDVHDVITARLALEEAGVRAWPDAVADARQAVHEAVETYARTARTGAGPGPLAEAHLAVHRSLVGLTGSSRLVTTATALNGELRLALAGVDRRRGNAEQQVSEHRDLVRVIESGDSEAAVVALRAHLADAEESMRDAVTPDTTPPG